MHKCQLPSVINIAILFKIIILVLKSDYCKLKNSNVSSNKVKAIFLLHLLLPWQIFFSVPEKPYPACLNALRKPLHGTGDTRAGGKGIPALTPRHCPDSLLLSTTSSAPTGIKCPKMWFCVVVKTTRGEHACTSKFPVFIPVLAKPPSTLQ